MMKQLIDVKKLTDKKFLNLYEATYKLEDGSTTLWDFASRKPLNNIDDMNKVAKEKKPDAVNIGVHYFDDDGNIHFILIREYRSPFNAYFISFPAGLIEKGETAEEAAAREVKEEVGGVVINSHEFVHFASTSAGVSNEGNAFVNVEISPNLQKQQLEKTEDIEVLDVTESEVKAMMNDHKNTFEMSTYISLLFFLECVKYGRGY